MPRFKKFSGGTKITDFEPLEFELNDEKFHCNAAIQGSVLLEFAKSADSDAGVAVALYEFLRSAMSEEEYVRLDTILKSPDVIIDVELIGEIVSWLVEEYSSRPTSPPEDSSTGQ